MTIRISGMPRVLVIVALLTAGSVALYAGQLVETNAYVGIGELPFHLVEYWWLMAVWLLSLALVLPARPRVPSDVFLCLYVIGCALWSAGYWPATGTLDVGGAALLWALLLLPALAVKAMQVMTPHGPRRHDVGALALFPRALLVPTVLALLALAALLGYRVAGADAGFSVDEATLRRLQGRDSFSGNALPAYLLQMSANGLAPFAAFLGALRRSRTTVLCALGFAILCFWLLGLKSPLANVLVMGGLGMLVRSGRIGSTTTLVAGALILAMVVALIEMFVFDISLIAEFALRRVMLVNANIQSYFVDAAGRTPWLSLLISGIDLAGNTTPEYFVGSTYMGNHLTNANTNAFLHELATTGVVGYFAVIMGVCVVLTWCDRIGSRGRADGFAFATILALLLVEQAFTTGLVSSGLLLCMLLSSVFAARAPERPRTVLTAEVQL